MTGKHIVIAVAAALIALHPQQLRAQSASAPPPPPRVSASTAATPAAASPLLLPAPPATPAPPKVVVPASALPPKDSAVALCNNGTFVMEPGTAADCASRGGLRVAMPARVKAPVLRASTTRNVSAAIVEQAPPAGATMRCKDGTYLSGTASADRCVNNGGLAAILPTKPRVLAAPTAPAMQKRP